MTTEPALWKQVKAHGFTPEQILEAFQLTAPPVDPIAIAQTLGVKVLLVDSDAWDGAVDSHEDGRATIYINKGSSPFRQRFTVAHELGHLLKHPTGVAFRDELSRAGWDPREIEANGFAAELLMPSTMVAAYARVWPLESLHQVFGVSKEAMGYRLKNLGYRV